MSSGQHGDKTGLHSGGTLAVSGGVASWCADVCSLRDRL